MIETFLELFPSTPMPTIASDPFVMLVDLCCIILLAWLMFQRGRHFVVGWMGAAYMTMLLGFIGSFIWIYDRHFYNAVPTPQFALWCLKDIGVLMGLVNLTITGWRRRP